MSKYRIEDITPDFLADLKYRLITPEELDEALALARTLYTEEELQRHLDTDHGIPAEDVLRELEEAQRQRNKRAQ